MDNAFFTKSDNFKSEYSCAVVKVGKLTPIEGSDFLAKTDVFGTQIVVRKDIVKEGDVMFYASNETALNIDFLKVNNLFEIGCRDMNANADDVNGIMKEYQDNFKDKADKLRVDVNRIKGQISNFEKNVKRDKKKLSKLIKELDKCADSDDETKKSINLQIKDLGDKIAKATALSLNKTVVLTDLKKQIESLVNEGKPIVDKAKALCGFFNKYGRVRCITLKNTPSFGFLFGVESMANFNNGVNNVDLNKIIGTEFDTVDGELFVKAYVPPVKEVRHSNGTKADKRNNKLSRFDRMINGEFSFHYDTNPLQKNMFKLSYDSDVTATVKIHGTSICIGKVHIKNPLPMCWLKRAWNKLVSKLNISEKLMFGYKYNVEYGPVFSSRTVIKNQYINENVTEGFYKSDIWSEYGEIVYPYLENGVTIYGEIFGYLTGSQTMIQKAYPYGCREGENKLMIYRVTCKDEDGNVNELDVADVYMWTLNLIENMKDAGDENWKRIHPIDILYSGKLSELYPDVADDENWADNMLDKMKNDVEHFGMEQYEPLCPGCKVPREGIVLRINNDKIPEAFKLKTTSFALGEAILYDDDDYQDIEVQQGDY